MPELLCEFKWSPDGCIVETLPAGVYSDGELPARAQEIATELGIIKFGGGDDHSPAEPAATKRGKAK